MTQQPDGAEHLGYPALGGLRPTSAVLGWIALAVGALSLIGSVVNALIVASLLDPQTLDRTSDGGSVAVSVGLVLASGLLLWFGFGLWAIVQGVIAAVQRRGIGPGIAGVALGLVGPWVGVVIAIATVTHAWATV